MLENHLPAIIAQQENGSEDAFEVRTTLADFFSILLCGLRRIRAYDRVPLLHLARGKWLWPQNRKKGLLFGIGGAGVDPTVPLPGRLPCRESSPARRRHHPIRIRVREFPSPFPPLSFH